jgi:signal transduction histidine kinase
MGTRSRIARRIAAGFAVLAAGILGSAFGIFLYLERGERDRLAEEVLRAAREAAPGIEREATSILARMPPEAAEPYPAPLETYFSEKVALDRTGTRTFPPAVKDELPFEERTGIEAIEAVEEARRLAASGRAPEALEVPGAGARDPDAAVRWASLMAIAEVYERSSDPRRAVPYLERAAGLEGHPVRAFAARLRRAEVEGALDPAQGQAAYRSILDDLAIACASWSTPNPAPLGPQAARFFSGKATAALRAQGEEPPASAISKIEEAILARQRVEAMARAIAAEPGRGGFVSLATGAEAGEPAPFIAFRRSSNGHGEAFRLRWAAWEAMADRPTDATATGSMAISFHLIGPGMRPSGSDAAILPLGAPPLDGISLQARPADGAMASALASFRLRAGAAIGSLTLLFLLAAGLGARNLARAAALSRAREEFALSTSHEIRTPLTLIRAASETLATRELGPEARKPYLRTLVVESRRLSEMVSRILDLRKLDEGPGPAERQQVDLAEIAREAAESFAPLLAETGFECRVDAPSPAPVRADPEALASAIQALLENAQRYTPRDAPAERKGIDLRVRRNGARAILEVADRGIGIPEAEREKVFERYHRTPEALRSGVRGAGLGLSIVRKIVEDHGGEASIAANMPSGTVARISIPLAGDGDGEA